MAAVWNRASTGELIGGRGQGVRQVPIRPGNPQERFREPDAQLHLPDQTSTNFETEDRLSVKPVVQKWLVYEDGVVANRLQEEEIQQHYNMNRQQRRTVRDDIPVAKHLYTEEEARAQAERLRHLQQQHQLAERDAEIARNLQQQLGQRERDDVRRRQLHDEAIARQMQETQPPRRRSADVMPQVQPRMSDDVDDDDLVEAADRETADVRTADRELAVRLQKEEEEKYERKKERRQLAKERRRIEQEIDRTQGSGERNQRPVVAKSHLEDAGDFSDFYVPPDPGMDPVEYKRLQEEQDAEIARLIQDQEKKRTHNDSLREKQRQIEAQDAELARIMQEEEKLRAKRHALKHRQKQLQQQEQEARATSETFGDTFHTPNIVSMDESQYRASSDSVSEQFMQAITARNNKEPSGGGSARAACTESPNSSKHRERNQMNSNSTAATSPTVIQEYNGIVIRSNILPSARGSLPQGKQRTEEDNFHAAGQSYGPNAHETGRSKHFSQDHSISQSQKQPRSRSPELPSSRPQDQERHRMQQHYSSRSAQQPVSQLQDHHSSHSEQPSARSQYPQTPASQYVSGSHSNDAPTSRLHGLPNTHSPDVPNSRFQDHPLSRPQDLQTSRSQDHHSGRLHHSQQRQSVDPRQAAEELDSPAGPDLPERRYKIDNQPTPSAAVDIPPYRERQPPPYPAPSSQLTQGAVSCGAVSRNSPKEPHYRHSPPGSPHSDVVYETPWDLSRLEHQLLSNSHPARPEYSGRHQGQSSGEQSTAAIPSSGAGSRPFLERTESGQIVMNIAEIIDPTFARRQPHRSPPNEGRPASQNFDDGNPEITAVQGQRRRSRGNNSKRDSCKQQ